MELKDVYELWDRFDKSEKTDELHISMDGVSLKLKKKKAVEVVAAVGAETVVQKSVQTQAVEEPKAAAGKAIKAPLVGTFYRASSPEAEPFVSVGQTVKKGDVVGIIEAMKLMNEIAATEDGVIEDILVNDGDMVEYNQALFVLQ